MLLSLAACNKDTDEDKEYKTRSMEISRIYFNTRSIISTYADYNDDNIKKYRNIADEVLSYYHELFDIYYEYSGVNNICTINKNAGKSAVKVDPELIDFLSYCKELYTITGGKTNIMLGSVLSIWHDKREIAEDVFGTLVLDGEDMPTPAELEAASLHTSIDSLVIDREASTVYVSDPEASIDVGAIAKGYTVDILYNRLKDEGADSVVLNIGGNIRTIGLKPDGNNWATGISNPDTMSDNTLICRLSVGSTSIVTSGNYERYMLMRSKDDTGKYVVGEKKYHHIIDPDTLMPSEYFSSVSIITENSGLADALSTTLFCMSYEDGLALVEKIGGIEVIWVDTEYNVYTTPGVNLIS